MNNNTLFKRPTHLSIAEIKSPTDEDIRRGLQTMMFHTRMAMWKEGKKMSREALQTYLDEVLEFFEQLYDSEATESSRLGSATNLLTVMGLFINHLLSIPRDY